MKMEKSISLINAEKLAELIPEFPFHLMDEIAHARKPPC